MSKDKTLNFLQIAFLWGILPIYWKSLIPISSYIIILYRIVWVGIICFFLAIVKHGFEEIKKPLLNKKILLRYILAGLVITGNWNLYIWSVNAGYILQTSVGYYLEPLVVCMIGIIVFKEKINTHKAISFILASIAIIILIVWFNELPFIALGLALSFAAYAALKKICDAPPLVSVFYETVLLVPICLSLIIYYEINGKGAISQGEPYQYALLMLSGIFTATPLLLFSKAAQHIPFITLGMTEYIMPTIGIVLGLVYGEKIGLINGSAFIIICIALVIFTRGEVREYKRESLSDSADDSADDSV